MTIRRKVVASTIAASVALTAFAGIPLSSKGLAEKLGVNGVAYAATYDDYVAKAEKVYGFLSQSGINDVNAFRDQLADAFGNGSILEPVVEAIVGNDATHKATLNGLVNELLDIEVGPNWKASLETVKNNYKDKLKDIGDLYNSDLTVDDFAAVINAFENKMIALAPTIAALPTNNASADSDIAELIRKAIKESLTASPALAAIETQVGLETEQFQEIFNTLKDGDKITRKVAIDAFLQLYRAYNLAFPAPTSGGGIIITGPSVSSDAAAAAAALTNLKDKIANATDAEKAALIAEATKTAQDAINKVAAITSPVTVVDGKASVKVDDNKALSAILSITAVVDALKAAAPTAVLAPIKLNVDLGTVTQDQISTDVSKAVVEAAIKANVAAVVLKSGDLAVELPVGGTLSGAINFGVNKQDATPEQTGGKPAASQVFDFTLAVDGQPKTTFNKPILIQLPLNVTSDIDTELLSLAKIIEGKLQFFGGRYKNGSLTEARDTFSSYVVVENKVAFDDLSRVEAWAGRSIEVVAAKGAIDGKSEGVFAPDDKVTRAEFAKMLLRALDLDNSNAVGSFADVNTNAWFAPYVAAAAEQGIIFGRNATTFDPNATITRAEMAAMIARAVKAVHGTEDVADVEAALAGFSDAGQISPSLKKSVAFVASNNIVVGSNGKFAPNSHATRAEAAVIIYKAFKYEQ